jgi:hypothetical protein
MGKRTSVRHVTIGRRLSFVGAFLITLSNAATAAEEPAVTAFVTMKSFKGDFGGLTEADAICQAEAEQENSVAPEGQYLAWLSDANTNPLARFTRYEGPVVLPDGTMVAESFSDLVDGSLLHPINMDASGKTIGTMTVWTGTNADGSGTGSSGFCSGWTATSGRGLFGSTATMDSTWSSYQVRRCHHRHKLFCFQQ